MNQQSLHLLFPIFPIFPILLRALANAPVELKKRCDDCPPWRTVDFRDDKQPTLAKQEKASVQAGFTALYAFPGMDYFANTKVEQSAPGIYEQDKAIVTGYLGANPKIKEQVDAQVPEGKEYTEFEAATYNLACLHIEDRPHDC